jgi:uncharacterized protein
MGLIMKIKIYNPTEKELTVEGVKTWPIWTCEPSTFDWFYDEKETCLILEGEVTVETETETVSFKTGDMVVFPKNLSCVWNVKKAVRKHYKFG